MAILGLLGNIITIMDLAIVVSSGNVDCLLQLGLRASTVSLEDKFEELLPFRCTYRSDADMGDLPLHHPEQYLIELHTPVILIPPYAVYEL